MTIPEASFSLQYPEDPKKGSSEEPWIPKTAFSD